MPNDKCRVLGRMREGTLIRDEESGRNFLRIRANTHEGRMTFDYPVLSDGSVQADFGIVQPRDARARKRITDLMRR